MSSLIEDQNKKSVSNKYFAVTKDIVDNVRESFGVSENDIKRDVEALKEWLKKQPHLPQNLEDTFIEKMLLCNKFRIEKTKTKMDSYFSIRSLDPEMFDDLDKFRISNRDNVLYFMPKLTPNNYRIVVGKLNSDNLENYSIEELLKNLIILIELLIKSDYNSGIYVIIDMKGFTLAHAARVNLNVFAKLVKLTLNIMSVRFIAVDVTTAPSYAVPLINFVKSLIKHSLVKKISVYKDLSGLLDRIPEDCLPEELGGTCSCQKDLLNDFDEMVKENQDHLRSLKNIKSDESKRINDLVITVHDFGLDGSFKQLNFD